VADDKPHIRVQIALLDERAKSTARRLDDAIKRLNSLHQHFVRRTEWEPRRKILDGMLWLVVSTISIAALAVVGRAMLSLFAQGLTP